MMAKTMTLTHPVRSLCEDVTDEELVALTMAGRTEAFDVLVSRYWATFLRVAWNLVKNETEAEDVVQSAFTNMFRKLHTFKPGSSFRNWAYRVVTNTGLMRLRKKRTRREVDLERVHPTQVSDATVQVNDIAPSWTVRADKQLENKELRAVLDAAIEELPPKYHVVFVMRELDGLPLKPIGAQLGLSIPAVKSRLHRSRAYLRATVEPYLDGRV